MTIHRLTTPIGGTLKNSAHKGPNQLSLTTIGIDVGGTNIKYALVNGSGKILYEGCRSSDGYDSARAVIKNIIDIVEDVRCHVDSIHNGPVAIGVGVPGLINMKKGIVLGGAENIRDWKNIPLKDTLEKACRLPVIIDNDANLIALGEMLYGAARNCTNAIVLSIGTGIGGAIIINKQLFRGSNNAAGELGCLIFDVEKSTTRYAKNISWEDRASTKAMLESFSLQNNTPEEEIDGKELFALYHLGNPIARKVIEENTRLLGVGIASLINIFNPEKIILSGGVSEAGDFYVDMIKTHAFKYAKPECMKGVKIEQAELGNKGGFLGAAFCASELVITHAQQGILS